MISGYTFGVVVPADSPFRSFDDLLAGPPRTPGGSRPAPPASAPPPTAMEDVLGRRGIDYVHVPYRGTADQMLAVANGSLMAGVNSTGFAPFVESGKMRLLAIFSDKRSPRWPQVPTVAELGFPGAVHTAPYGIAVPRGTDARIVRRLHDAFRLAMQDPPTAELAKYDQSLSHLDTEHYEAYTRDLWQQESASPNGWAWPPGRVRDEHAPHPAAGRPVPAPGRPRHAGHPARAQGSDPLGSPQWPAVWRDVLGGGRVVFDPRVKVSGPCLRRRRHARADRLRCRRARRGAAYRGGGRPQPDPQGAGVRAGPAARGAHLPLRQEQASPVRVAVRDGDGVWHVGGILVNAAGGGCTVPGDTRRDGSWEATLNRVEARVFPAARPARRGCACA